MPTANLPEQHESDAAIEPAPVQPDFFDDGSFGVELSKLDEAETRHGKYTGAELERRTQVRDMVVKALAQGVGIRAIARQLRGMGVAIGEHSILALRDRRPDLVATEKKQLSQQLGRIVKLSADNIEERLIAGTFKPSSVDLGIFIDKKMVLDGDASLVIEHKFTIDASPEAFTKRLEAIKKARVTAVQDSQASEIIEITNK